MIRNSVHAELYQKKKKKTKKVYLGGGGMFRSHGTFRSEGLHTETGPGVVGGSYRG